MLLGRESEGRNNNLNLLRFIAASLVLFSHCVPFSRGMNHSDILYQITKGQITFGGVAVSMFFLYGGFLIAKSMERIKDGKQYFKARAIRIFPCLATVVFLCVFLLGPVITTYPLAKYFTDVNTYKYLLNSVFVLVHSLPGVFENNIYGTTVNGPLWTLPVEFLCYIMCFVLYKTGLMKKKKVLYTIPVYVVMYVIIMKVLANSPVLLAALRPATLFYIGIIFYIYRDMIRLDIRVVAVCVVCLIASCVTHTLFIGIYLFLPYALFFLAYGTKHKCAGFGKNAELSYGMYLLGSPVQQTVTLLFGGSMNPLINFIVSLPIDILGAYLLFRLVEKPITKLQKKKKLST